MSTQKKKKSYYAEDATLVKLAEVSKKLGVTDNFVLDVALKNFINLPLDTQLTLVARYHLLNAIELDPKILEKTDEEIKALLNVEIHEKKKK